MPLCQPFLSSLQHFATLLISLRSLIGWKWRHAAAFIAFCSSILAIWTVELAQVTSTLPLYCMWITPPLLCTSLSIEYNWVEVESLSHLLAAQFQRSISYLDTMARRASTSHNGGVEEKKKPTFFKIIKPGFNTEHLVVSNPGHFLLNLIVSLQIMHVSWSLFWILYKRNYLILI